MSIIDLTTNVPTRGPSRVESQPARVLSPVTRPAPVTDASTGTPTSEGVERSSPSPANGNLDVVETVERLNNLIQMVRRELHFSVDGGSGQTIIQVIDSESQEVVRQIPPEEVLTLMTHLEEANRSLMMDLQA